MYSLVHHWALICSLIILCVEHTNVMIGTVSAPVTVTVAAEGVFKINTRSKTIRHESQPPCPQSSMLTE